MTHPRESISRRQFLHRSSVLGTGLLVGPAALNLSCSDSSTEASSAIRGDDVLLGLYPSSDYPTAEGAMRAALRKLDFSWLAAGDSVLVKIAANSGNPHPATTHPDAVRGLVAELKERGAGQVVVGEQSGVEHVRHLADGTRFSSTRERLDTAGLLSAIESSGALGHYFDDQDWGDYFEGIPPAGSNWDRPMMLPNIVREVDHIVYLPRLSSHVLAGYTHGHKLAVGWLREDSRNHLHAIADTFYEKYTEINYVPEIRDRLRLVVTFADKALLDFGPDEGTVHEVDPRLVVASSNLANHDVVATGLLVQLDAAVPENSTCIFPVCTYSTELVDTANRVFVQNVVAGATGGLVWGPHGPSEYVPVTAHTFEQGISQDRPLLRAWEITGERPANISVVTDGAALAPEVRTAIESRAEGAVAFS